MHHSHSWCKTLCHELQSALTRGSSILTLIQPPPLPLILSRHMLKETELEHTSSVKMMTHSSILLAG